MKHPKTVPALFVAGIVLLAACGTPAPESGGLAVGDQAEAVESSGTDPSIPETGSTPSADSLPPSESLPPEENAGSGGGDYGYGDYEPIGGGNSPPSGEGDTTGVQLVPDPYLPPVEFAIADLAARLGVDESAIAIVYVEAVTWPDGSMGCPQPGMAYTQVLVDGMRVVLSVGGVEYAYHSGGDREPFLCEPELSALEGAPIIEGTIIVGEKPEPPGAGEADTDSETDDYDY